MRARIQRQRRTTPRIFRVLLLGISVAVLVIVVAVTTGAIGAASGLIPGYTPGKLGGPGGRAPTGQKGHATCDEPGQPACPTPNPFWSAVTTATPQDILADLQANPAYLSPVEVENASSGSTYAFDTPVLVMPATTGNRESQYNLPHFVVRASVNGIRCVTYDVIFDSAHQQLRIGSIGIGQPHEPNYNKPFPWDGVSSSAAISRVQMARGTSIASGSTAVLVYFGPNPNLAIPNNPVKWTGGGTDATDPIWRLRGSDGHLYFVGTDGNVYTLSQLPIEPGASIVQP